jgi:predicted nucleic acid-binding protein
MSRRQEKKRKYLLDTSALYPMLISGVVFNADECAVTSLTEYEVGNVLWRENKRAQLKDPKRIAEIFEEAIRGMQISSIDSIVAVLTLSIKRNLTFYDASYVHIAEKENLKLVTEDAELLKKCKSAIKLEEMNKNRKSEKN